MNMYKDQQFIVTWLEKQMFDVAKQYIFPNIVSKVMVTYKVPCTY